MEHRSPHLQQIAQIPAKSQLYFASCLNFTSADVDAVAYFERLVVSDVEAGDHRLVLARVVAGEVLVADGEPLLYASTGDLDRSTTLYPQDFCEH